MPEAVPEGTSRLPGAPRPKRFPKEGEGGGVAQAVGAHSKNSLME
jgi:hypothetical protein